MKRKLTALSLAFLMLLAGIMTAFAAEDTVSVYSLGNITAAEDGVYYLPVTVDKFHFDKAEDGYSVFAMYVYFDSRKLSWDKEIVFKSGTVTAADAEGNPSVISFNAAITVNDPNELRMMWYSISDKISNETINDGVLGYIPFRAVEGAKGTAKVYFKDVQAACLSGQSFAVGQGISVTEGSVKLTEDKDEDDFSVKSVVRVKIPDEISVAYNTEFSAISLPETVTVIAEDGTEIPGIGVEWKENGYNKTISGSYEITGILNIDDVVNNLLSNSTAIKAVVRVYVDGTDKPEAASPLIRMLKNPLFHAKFGGFVTKAIDIATE